MRQVLLFDLSIPDASIPYSVFIESYIFTDILKNVFFIDLSMYYQCIYTNI